MAVLEYVARQLRRPSGLIGRFVVVRVLNRGNAPMNRLTLSLLDLKPDDRVLEVGFGGGDLIHRMSAVVTRGRIVGVDFSPDMVDTGARRFAALIRGGRVELRCASVEALPYPPGEFTKACAVNTIYFWPEPAGPLAELARVLRTGGRLVLCFNPPATLANAPFTKYGFSFHEPAEVRRLLEAVGFASVELVPGSTRLGPFVCAVATR